MVVWNERVKLLANLFNGIAVAMIALGILAPIANMLFQDGAKTNDTVLVWWALGALALHGIARSVLEDLRE